MNVSSKRVLVTGASGGLGAAIALAFHRAGSELVLTGRRRDALDDVAAKTNGQIIEADLGTDDGIEKIYSEAGRVDVLIANAGIGGMSSILDFDPQEIDQILEVNLRTPIRMSQHYAKEMVERGEGHISLVSSLAGKAASAGSSLYSGSKFGLRGFGVAIREDLAPHNVGVSVVLPGFIRDAGMFAENDMELPGFVGTNSPEEVGTAVLQGVQKNQGQVTIAPVLVKSSANLANFAPNVSSWLSRRAPIDFE